MADIEGYAKLRARIAAVKEEALGGGIMRLLATAAVAESKALVPRRTGNLARSIHIADVTETSARVAAGAKYAPFVEEGTGPHEITPNARKALRWAASPAGMRLTGTPTKAAQRGLAGGVVFATHVNHPGTRATPFLKPGAERAIEKAGIAERIVAAWDHAA